MSISRDRIKISEIGIQEVRPRRIISGGLALEISGKESITKADTLTGHLKKILPETGEIKIAHRIKKTDLRISGLEDSIASNEVALAVATAGTCEVADVKTGKIR